MLLYRLEVKNSQLIIHLKEHNSRRILYADTMRAQAMAVDLPAIQFLTKLHARGRPLDTLSFQEILIPAHASNEAIRLIGATGRLYLRDKIITLAPKRARLFWTQEGATFEAWLVLDGREVALRSAELLFGGALPWAIVASQWVEIETNVAWSWIAPFQEGARLLEGVQKKRFLEEGPEVRRSSLPAQAPLQTLPILKLSDASGSFANLWIDYEGIGSIAFDDLAPQIGGHVRLRKEEASWEKDLIEAGFARKVVGGSQYYCPTDKVREALCLLLEVGWRCCDARGKKVLQQTSLSLHISEGASIRIGGGPVFQGGIAGTLRSAFAAAQRERLFLELDGANIGLLNAKTIPIFKGLWEEDELVLPKWQIGELAPLLGATGVTWDAAFEQTLRSLDSKNAAPAERHTETFFCGTLLPYQSQGVEWLHLLQQKGFHALLADEMGLGKTVQVLAFFSQLRTNLPILIVAPTSLLFNWRSEIARFWQSAEVYVHSGLARLSDIESIQNQQVVLTSYALLRQDLNLFRNILFESVALDESQAIKSSASLTAAAAFAIQAKFKIAMTGTPIENRSEELWSQFHFLEPELLGDRSDFQKMSAETARQRVRPFLLRRSKEQVQIQLPEKMDQPLWVEMTEAQQALYDQTLAAFRGGLLKKIEADGLGAHQMAALEVILRLRQICSDPRLLGKEDPGAKAQLVSAMADEWVSTNHKSLIFSQFTTFLRFLQRDLQSIGIEPLYLDGQTPADERGEIVRRFQEESTPHVFLLSLKAGGVGLNLTAAQHVALLDPWWNEAVERQAIDRAHRIGQKNRLWVHRFLTPGAIEEKMLQIKARKTDCADAFLSEGAAPLDDLMDLLLTL